MRRNERFDFFLQGLVSTACVFQKGGSLAHRAIKSRVKYFSNLSPTFRSHIEFPGDASTDLRGDGASITSDKWTNLYSSFRLSHARAIFQSRSTVAWPMLSTSAVSALESPPKNRSSTMRSC